MIRSKLAAAVSMCMMLGIATPAFSADASTGSEGLDKAVQGSLIVTRVGGLGTGLVIGTPVAAVRQTWHHYSTWTPAWAEHVGGKDCGPCMGAVSIVSLPLAVVWGAVTGTYYGGKNALEKGFNEPFHPDSFSLSKDYAGE